MTIKQTGGIFGRHPSFGDIDVTGTVTADGLTVDGNAKINSTSPILTLSESDTTDLNTRFSIFGGGFRLDTISDDGLTAKKRITVGNGSGDISFYEDTGTTAKFFWDASAESLGIGTSSPSDALHIYNTSSLNHVRIDGPSGINRNLNFSTSGSTRWNIYTNSTAESGSDSGSNLTIAKYTDAGVYNGVAMFIERSSGNVGIGTSSPAVALDVTGEIRATNRYLANTGGGANKGYQFTGDGNTGMYSDAADTLQFSTGGTERMRIDSSGNLLVGKTAATISTDGAELRPTGEVVATTNGLNVAYFNRRSSDGSIVDFRKDGSTVGSIGAGSSNAYISGATRGLHFTGTAGIIPCNEAGASRDADTDLGKSTTRFKDLYLSGGVYLGGTGSANKLDDYEEGTWTPTLSASTTAPTVSSYSDRVGRYVKVGRMVTAMCQIRANLSSAGSGYPIITGLPFVSQNIYYMGASVGLQNLFSTIPQEGFIGFQGTTMRFDNATYRTGVNNYICFNITYEHD